MFAPAGNTSPPRFFRRRGGSSGGTIEFQCRDLLGDISCKLSSTCSLHLSSTRVLKSVIMTRGCHPGSSLTSTSMNHSSGTRLSNAHLHQPLNRTPTPPQPWRQPHPCLKFIIHRSASQSQRVWRMRHASHADERTTRDTRRHHVYQLVTSKHAQPHVCPKARPKNPLLC